MSSTLTADQHKLMGNEHFKLKAFDEAIAEYSTAIVKDPKVAAYYSNRANCYLKLEKYTMVVSDCERVVELEPKSVKGYYFMGKANLELSQPSEAYAMLKKAYEFALEQRSSFTKDIVLLISEAKKQKWLEEERRRIAQVSETYRYLAGLIEGDFQRQVDALDTTSEGYQESLSDFKVDRAMRLEQLETMMQRAGAPHEYAKPYLSHKDSLSNGTGPQSSPNPNAATTTPREVPDYMLDKITFEFMHDPVISTKSGISYERATLLEHFSHGRMFDPVAQVPLTERDIIPNRALKEACEDFISKNGWAVDY
ncbi:STIP1 homology and U-box containing protein 1 [Entomortierella parvispora]|uniref:RING-type E3 ubiquitin transferase n=1 Tax=Entomortierella parvispora TaxID=205924 RepID=A0A9P3HJ14_9FUNG|nr:STIP1 homology and U-box containing protein 1 [Entomortierella parvispora]